MTYPNSLQIHKTPVTWVLIANGRHAQVYNWQKEEKLVPLIGNSKRNKLKEVTTHLPVPVSDLKWEAESPEQYQVGRNSTGMVFESVGGARHMAEPHITVQEEIKQHFAKIIATGLDKASGKKSFDRLVLVAPAKMLGEIKKQLDDKLASLIIAEIPKDFTAYKPEVLALHLKDIVNGTA